MAAGSGSEDLTRHEENIPILFHVDVNSAFLSWSAVKKLKENPEALDLRTVPSVICGDIETRHGIVTAKSIPAKKYGIETAEPVASALRKCPNLILEKSDFKVYREYSKAFIHILESRTDLVEQVSIDEAYMDITEYIMKMQPLSIRAAAINAAIEIKEEIRDKLGFTVNVGISHNKLLAKTASDFQKPDRVHTLWPEEIPQKLWPLDIGILHGCGGATASRLRGVGVRTIGDAAHLDEDMLQSLLGNKAGTYIWRSANGMGSCAVHADHGDAKSYSNETTLAEDITADSFQKEAAAIVRRLSDSVSRRLQRDGMYAQTISVMIKTDGFDRYSRQMTLQNSVNDADTIDACAFDLLSRLMNGENGLFSKGMHIRLIGVGGSKLDHGDFRQLSLFDLLPSDSSMEETQTEGTDLANDAEKSEKSYRSEEAYETNTMDLARETEPSAGTEKVFENSRLEKLESMMIQIRGRYGEAAVVTGDKLKSMTDNN